LTPVVALIGDALTRAHQLGLSDFGVELVEHLVEHLDKVAVLIDLSHCVRQTTLDGIALLSGRPRRAR
jgi:membrane dipeptidase